jgi:hypothetical protein
MKTTKAVFQLDGHHTVTGIRGRIYTWIATVIPVKREMELSQSMLLSQLEWTLTVLRKCRRLPPAQCGHLAMFQIPVK